MLTTAGPLRQIAAQPYNRAPLMDRSRYSIGSRAPGRRRSTRPARGPRCGVPIACRTRSSRASGRPPACRRARRARARRCPRFGLWCRSPRSCRRRSPGPETSAAEAVSIDGTAAARARAAAAPADPRIIHFSRPSRAPGRCSLWIGMQLWLWRTFGDVHAPGLKVRHSPALPLSISRAAGRAPAAGGEAGRESSSFSSTS